MFIAYIKKIQGKGNTQFVGDGQVLFLISNKQLFRETVR